MEITEAERLKTKDTITDRILYFIRAGIIYYFISASVQDLPMIVPPQSATVKPLRVKDSIFSGAGTESGASRPSKTTLALMRESGGAENDSFSVRFISSTGIRVTK